VAFSDCVEIPPLPAPNRVTLPGGASIERIKLIEVIQPALTPLAPIFDVIDAIVATFNCIKAIPESFGPPPDPTILAAVIPDLAQKVAKLLKLVPQLSMPFTIVGVIDLVIDTMVQVRAMLLPLVEKMSALGAVELKAVELQDPKLAAIAQCARANIGQEMANLGKGLAALDKLIGLLNSFLEMIGGPQLPTLATLGETPIDDAVRVIDELVETIKTVRAAIPVP
jgi:hypothetical protein